MTEDACQRDLDAWRQQQENEEERRWELHKEMHRLMTENPDDNPLDLVFLVPMTEAERTQMVLDLDPGFHEFLDMMEKT